MSAAPVDPPPTRVLVAKPGLDGHDRGARVLAQALRDNSMEVIYTGLRAMPEMVASAAVQEDIDVICVSILSGAHNGIFRDIVECLWAQNADEIPVLGGGVISSADIDGLKAMGVHEIFTPGSKLNAITEYIREVVGR